ncbi:MAG: MarR family transcriptional regulator [Intrasporangium sp.]|uniref:MarR family winged helix-turn-helix transcriptional regulator n=1 Tax=Intrasporangium sp. TaxID=1925024 RepID=UPI002649585E|nr:MarR family transcriptional regulator [Intrasporangium sp.]MDN5798038.1 MarR family transcriptional regulator [Intrasporangium sp.]
MAAKPRSLTERHRKAVASYVAAGGEETVQRVITAIYAVTKRLDQWYSRQLADLDLTQGEWAVLTGLATARDECLTPSQLADATSVAPSSMTHRLDKMAARGLVARRPDPTNRTRTLVSLTHDGWELFSHSTRESNVVESETLRDLDDGERVELARLLEVVITGLDETVESPGTRRS